MVDVLCMWVATVRAASAPAPSLGAWRSVARVPEAAVLALRVDDVDSLRVAAARAAG
eukprot:SAG31_NODE_9068_length_1340_cov_1.614021_1_plen_56_part_10